MVFEGHRYLFGIDRVVGGADPFLAEHFGADRFIGPVDIGPWVVFFGNEPVHRAGTFGLFGVINGIDTDAALLLEISQYRLRKDLIFRHIDSDALLCISVAAGCQEEQGRECSGKQYDAGFFDEVLHLFPF